MKKLILIMLFAGVAYGQGINPIMLLFGAPAAADTTHYVNATKIIGDGNLDLSAIATNQLILPISNDAVTPTIAFGDGNDGFYQVGDNQLNIALNGAVKYYFQDGNIQAGVGGSFYLTRAAGTVSGPTYAFGGDANTGVWHPSADSLGFSCNSTNILTLGDEGAQFTVGLIMGSPTGGLKGAGTINATAVYDDNTILTGDYVFEAGFEYHSINEMESFYTKNKHLPTLTSQAEMIEMENMSLGERLNEVIVTVEIQAKYIAELEARLAKLEK